MESFARRGEDVLLGESPYGQYGNSTKSTNEDSDMDFSDVFGGPPRRFSMQEMRLRHSFCEPMESDHQDSVYPEKPWSGFDEKPVFGSENVSRRSNQNDDFFGDIFRRDDSRSYSSPRMSKDVFGSSPVSRILSPARPLPPKAEPFSTSVPAQFSLPAKLTKAMDFPVFGSASRNLYNKSKDGIANGGSHSPTSNVSLSRFSSQAMELPDETRQEESLYHQSPLSNKVSVSSEKLTYETKSVEKEEGEMWKNNSQIADASKNCFQFHFSIYKWAGKGVPLLMPVLESNKLRCKYRSRMERCSSSNGRIHCDSTYNRDLSEVEDKVGGKKREERSKEIKMKSKDTVKGTDSEISDSDSLRSSRHLTPNGEAISERNTDEKSSFKDEVDLCEKTEKEAYTKGEQAQKPVQKPLKALFNDEKQEEGSEFDGEENNAKISTEANEDSKVSSLGKKTTSERKNSNKAEETNASLQGSARVSGNAWGKSAVKGTVREFVKIFNQDTSDNPRTNSEVPSQSSRWKGIDINGMQKEIKNVINIEEKGHAFNTQEMPDAASCKEDHSLKADKQHTHSKSSVHKTSTLFTNDKNARCFSDSLPNNHKAKVENRDESFQGHFLVEELTVGLDKDPQTEGDSENMKGLDAKIQQWSNGRKGNIRSLLSTLQLVLWSGSGWKPVPLVDIIEGSGVKRTYQKALLCLHPDKLQQKGAESHQKYIAARVFDILQEAWDHFNSLGAI